MEQSAEPTTAGPPLVCFDCNDLFHWTSSPSLERCLPCTAIRAEYLGIPEEEA